jgi:deoxycytidylate deaminase
MKRLDKKDFEFYLGEAIKEARKSTCLRRKCGSIIVDIRGNIIGRGFNSPAGNLESQRRCSYDKSEYDEKVTDKTCCIHAEQNAFFDALSKTGKRKLENYPVLYFAEVDSEGNLIPAGEPYCTICSKSALEVGISGWVLQHESGLYYYDSEEYNDKSFNFGK